MHITNLTSRSAARARPVRRPSGRAGAILAGAGLIGLAIAMGAPAAKAQFRPGEQTARLSIADLVERVKPAVVSISVISGGGTLGFGGPRGSGQFGNPDDPRMKELNEFLKKLLPQFRGDSPLRRRPTQAQGSGFFISADGYVVTNNHVIDGATKITVTTDSRKKLKAVLVGTDPSTDIALLKVTGSKAFPFVRLAKKKVRLGEEILAVGNPFGLNGTVTKGIVSALDRSVPSIGSGAYGMIQVDAAINKGNSGGPTFNLDGEVIGVNTAIFSRSGGNDGIAFAVPAATVAFVVDQLKSRGSVERGWLGVSISDLNADIAEALRLNQSGGAVVNEVLPNTPAEAAGLRVGDVIVGVDNRVVDGSRALTRIIGETAPDSKVALRVMRDRTETTVNVQLGLKSKRARKLSKAGSAGPGKTDTVDQLGLTLAPAKGSPGSVAQGVEIKSVDPDSNAAANGLKAGDIILKVSSNFRMIEVNSPADIAAAVDEARKAGGKALAMMVKSGGRQRLVGVRFFTKKG